MGRDRPLGILLDPKRAAWVAAEYRKRRRNQIIVAVVGLVGVILLLVHVLLGFLIVLGCFLYTVIRWRCPNCGRYLGRGLSWKRCPRCKASFLIQEMNE
jgi:hypothetical protein